MKKRDTKGQKYRLTRLLLIIQDCSFRSCIMQSLREIEIAVMKQQHEVGVYLMYHSRDIERDMIFLVKLITQI